MERHEIGFRTARCSLGWLMVAGTARGVCVVMLGDSPEALRRELHEELPWARLVPGAGPLEAWTRGLVALAEGREPEAEIPLDVRGSRFQQRVWRALQGIPRGETRSYGAVARQLGLPRSPRAVARACASNPVALAIPCHRVVGADGELRGYRWGVERKQALLEREKESDLSLSSGAVSSAHGPARRRGHAA